MQVREPGTRSGDALRQAAGDLLELQRGELEALSLALELGAELILIDEKADIDGNSWNFGGGKAQRTNPGVLAG